MVVHYIAVIGSSSSFGIIKKSIELVEGYHKAGFESKGVFFFNEITKRINVEFIKEIEFQKQDDLYLQIEAYIKSINYEEDIIILRYPLSNSKLLKLFKKFPKKIWIEHNTREALEEMDNIKSLSVRDWVYIFRKFYFTDLFGHVKGLWNELFLAPKILQLAAGGLPVTDEIKLYEQKRCPSAYHCLTIGNGLDFSNLYKRAKPFFDKNTYHILMICSTAYNVHGADRLIDGLLTYKGNKSIKIHLIGKFTKKTLKLCELPKVKNKIIRYQKTFGEELLRLYDKIHLGVGSLGFHRLNAEEGSSLKIKEYISLGIPFVVSHREVDIQNVSAFNPFYAKVPSDDTPIDMNLLIDLIDNFYADNNFEKNYLEFVTLGRQFLDTSIKAKQVVQFILDHEK